MWYKAFWKLACEQALLSRFTRPNRRACSQARKLIEMPPPPAKKKKWMQNNCVILHPSLPTDYFWMGSFRTYPYPPPRRVREIVREGVSKRMQFPREWGVVSWGLFPGALSKTGKLLKTNSCSVEQAGGYFTVNSLLKQELLFWLMMFFIKGRRNVFFFFTAYTIGRCHWLS